jgi:hypothetical protein
MRYWTAGLLSAFATVCVAADSSPQFRFALSVQEDDQAPVKVDVAIPPGTSRTVHPTSRLEIEVKSPATTDAQSETVVRLIDISTGQKRILTESRTTGDSTHSRDYTFKVCKGTGAAVKSGGPPFPDCPQDLMAEKK